MSIVQEKMYMDSLLRRWFQAAVLPLDAALYAEIIKDRDEVKRCCECGATFQPGQILRGLRQTDATP